MAETTTDHEKIRTWAESKGGKPAAVERTHSEDDVGIIRIMFPDAPNSSHGALVEISWEEFFREFEDRQLALLYDENSMFSKIVGRDTVEKREHGDHGAARHSESSGGGQSARGGGSERAGGQASKGAESGGGSDSSAEYSLKEREYRDEDGNIRHHTNKYMEQHGGKGR